jgi:DNA-directed RNA polymerase specialized sigma24 family protein
LVFKLSIVGDFTDDEIALKLGIKKTTVKETARKGAGKLNLYRRDIKRLYIDEMRKMLNELSKFG